MRIMQEHEKEKPHIDMQKPERIWRPPLLPAFPLAAFAAQAQREGGVDTALRLSAYGTAGHAGGVKIGSASLS